MIYEVLINTDVEKAILFGSYAKNTSTSKSDIDLVIYTLGAGFMKNPLWIVTINLLKSIQNKNISY